jgi:hypothetical protein
MTSKNGIAEEKRMMTNKVVQKVMENGLRVEKSLMNFFIALNLSAFRDSLIHRYERAISKSSG